MAINHADKIENDDYLKRPYIAPAVTFLSVGEVEGKQSSHDQEQIQQNFSYAPS